MNLVQPLEKSVAPSKSVIEWEEADCPLCEGRRWEILMEAADPLPGKKGQWFAIVGCKDCGLCFTNPRPSQDTIGRFYPAEYRPHKSATKRGRDRFTRRYPALPRWLVHKHGLKNLPEKGRLLDFGCGGGLFLEQMRQLGWQVTGIDFSAQTVGRLRNDLGLEVLEGTLPHPQLAPESFQVITMWHSLEHVHQPKRILQAAYDLLLPGGKLIVALPTLDSLPFHWFGSSWYGLDLPRHLTHFTPETLSRMLRTCGFKIEAVRGVRHSSWLRMSARLAQKQRVGNRLRNWLLQFRPLSRAASWYCYLRNQSDGLMATAVKPVSSQHCSK